MPHVSESVTLQSEVSSSLTRQLWSASLGDIQLGPLSCHSESCPERAQHQVPTLQSSCPISMEEQIGTPHSTPYLWQDELFHRLVPQLIHLHATAWRTKASDEEGLLQMGRGEEAEETEKKLDVIFYICSKFLNTFHPQWP